MGGRYAKRKKQLDLSRSLDWVVLHVPFLGLCHCNSTHTNPVFSVGARVRSGYDHGDIIALPQYMKNLPLDWSTKSPFKRGSGYL